MRKLNMFLVAGILITFIIHAVLGSTKLFGSDSETDVLLIVISAFTCAALVAAHILVTVVLTVKTLRIQHRSGASYFKNNLMFWARRISGFAVMIPLVIHIFIFSGTNTDGAFRLTKFNTGRLISQIMLIVTIALHVLTNIEPMLISFGVKSKKAFSADLMFVISLILLTAAAAFAVYYIRWISI